MRARTVKRCGWAIAAAISGTLSAPAAQARDTEYSVSVTGGNLADALEELSSQTGISLAYEGRLPSVRAPVVRGRMSVRQALDQLLRDTTLQAVRVGPNTYRLVQRHKAREAAARAPAPADPPPLNPDIVVTARKLPESLSSLPAAVAVYVPSDTDPAGGTRDAREVARRVEGLSVTNLGPGRDRPFIRGLADSPFGGFSQSTVSVQIDEGRVTYDASEPGIQLTDIARVEVLKGPQGPLYGTGALGGVYRIVTNRPVIGAASGSARLGLQAVDGGGFGANAEAVLNLPVIGDRAALRVAGWSRSDAGWIDDLPGPKNANRSRTIGGRAGLRVIPALGWTVDLTGMAQRIRTRDTRYVSRDFEDLTRNVNRLEPQSGDFALAQGTISGPIGALRLTAVTSQAWQEQRDVLDASAAAAALGVPGAQAYRDRRSYRVFDQEVRLASAPGSRFAWAAGISYVSASTYARGDIDTSSATMPAFFELHRRVTEVAIFADGSFPILADLKLAVGVRTFRATTEDERLEALNLKSNARNLLGVTPSASLAWTLAPGQIVYARFGTAYRPGGIDPNNSRTGRYEADEVRSFDIGSRLRFDGGRLAVELAAFRSNWRHVQSDYLEANGLVATRNAGDAGIIGAEASLDWHLPDQWRLRAGMTIQRPRLERAPNDQSLPEDRRLPVVPDLAGRLEIARPVNLFGWQLAPYLAANYLGPTRLSFDDGLDRHMSSYVVARAGATFAVGPLDAQFDIDNLFDARADSFAYGNPFSIRTGRQFTPLRPRTLTFSLSRKF